MLRLPSSVRMNEMNCSFSEGTHDEIHGGTSEPKRVFPRLFLSLLVHIQHGEENFQVTLILLELAVAIGLDLLPDPLYSPAVGLVQLEQYFLERVTTRAA